ncbi:STAS/SEC14 domain-containing protein [Winogradskyella costae]|uniref:STAS/SEC14 domain-containing protein n=1 Tax=Winogradskyella costae TaxID=2697008 RepID=UPI0015C7491E|nr:STAS/SEC14 domain-containing protein [Winogradskyella costae]
MNYNPVLFKKPFETYNLKLGTVYVYANFLVSEFDEGADITFKNFDELAFIIKTHFLDKPFGFIANRKNSYSINLNDAKVFNETFKNLKAYAIIVYSDLTERIIEIESHFFKFNRKVFKDFDNAIVWIEDCLSKQEKPSYTK